MQTGISPPIDWSKFSSPRGGWSRIPSAEPPRFGSVPKLLAELPKDFDDRSEPRPQSMQTSCASGFPYRQLRYT